MNPALAKTSATFIVTLMSFLGWNTNEYAHLLPKEIKSEIVIETPTQNILTETTQTKIKKNIPQVNKKPTVTKIPTTKNKPSTKTPEVTLIKEPTKKIPQVTSTEINTTLPAPQKTTTPPQTKTENPIDNISNLSPEERIKKSTVNILCSMIKGNFIEKITGSGVVIDPQGVILTNAHVAEHVLLEEAGKETCFIRTGSPARNSYKAKVVYLPSSWVDANKNNLSIQNVTGTGENDYALLVLTEAVSSSAPNVPLTYLSPEDKTPTPNQKIILAGYPANFGDVKVLESGLYQLSLSSEVNQVMSFDGTSIGAINTAPTALAEHGSSGGAMATTNGTLLGIMVATTIDTYSGGKNIQGITLPYIKKSILQNSGKSLSDFLSNPLTEANNFKKEKVNTLSNILLQN